MHVLRSATLQMWSLSESAGLSGEDALLFFVA